MVKVRDLLVVAFAASTLVLSVACDDGATTDPTQNGTQDGGAAGGGGSGGNGGRLDGGGPGGTDGGNTGGGGSGGGTGGDDGGAGSDGDDGGAGSDGDDGGAAGEDGTGEPDPTPVPAHGIWGPSGRVNFLDIPASADLARDSGCGVAGSGAGSGLAALLSFTGGAGLSEFVQPDDQGEITLILLSQIFEWAGGAPVADIGTADIRLFNGEANDDGTFAIDARAFVDGDPANGPLISFPDMTIRPDGKIMGEPSTFQLEIPLVEGIPLAVTLEQAELEGRIFVDGPGFGLRGGILGGYFTRGGILDLIIGIQAACGLPDAPSMCDTVTAVIPVDGDPEDAMALVLTFVPLDAHLGDDGAARDCDPGIPDDCNSVGVCLLMEMAGVTIQDEIIQPTP